MLVTSKKQSEYIKPRNGHPNASNILLCVGFLDEGIQCYIAKLSHVVEARYSPKSSNKITFLKQMKENNNYHDLMGNNILLCPALNL